ncbi:phage holin family protein [Gracilibacillus sp. D59]|uniref:phage holin family protein n=1 Tax=Gracilibacillus sp. D59 TaxID=3457434 RepID=UPI003FCD69F8
MENQLLEYVTEEMSIVVAVLWIIGLFLKRTPKFPDWLIVWTLLILGVVVAVFVLGLTIDAFIQGVIVAGLAVLAHQLIKQTQKKDAA